MVSRRPKFWNGIGDARSSNLGWLIEYYELEVDEGKFNAVMNSKDDHDVVGVSPWLEHSISNSNVSFNHRCSTTASLQTNHHAWSFFVLWKQTKNGELNFCHVLYGGVRNAPGFLPCFLCRRQMRIYIWMMSVLSQTFWSTRSRNR